MVSAPTPSASITSTAASTTDSRVRGGVSEWLRAVTRAPMQRGLYKTTVYLYTTSYCEPGGGQMAVTTAVIVDTIEELTPDWFTGILRDGGTLSSDAAVTAV